MQCKVAVKSNSNYQRLVKDVPTLRLLLKAGCGNGFSAITAAYLSDRARINALKMIQDGDTIKEIKLKHSGVDVYYNSSSQLTDFWEYFRDNSELVDSIEFVAVKKGEK